MAALLGTRDTRDPSVDDPYSSRVDSVVSVHGVHDLPSMGDHLGEYIVRFLGGSYAERPAVWSEASPSTYVDEKSASMLLVHDPDDPVVPGTQATEFLARLKAAGRSASYIPTPGSGHGYFYNPAHPWTRKVWPQIVTWLQTQLGVSAP